MSIDALQEPHGDLKSPRKEGRSDASNLSKGRARIVGTLAVGAIAVVASIATIMPNVAAPKRTGPRLTHSIRRSDLLVTVIEQGTLESSENTEIKCKVRGENTVIWVVESGTYVEPGDELLRLDTLFIEEQIAERTKYALWSRSGSERSKADVAVAHLAMSEYLEGQFVADLMRLQKDLAVFEANLRSRRNMLSHSEMMAESGYVSELELEEKTFDVDRAKLNVDAKKIEIEVLEEFTKKERLEILRGNLAAVKATHEANVERAEADASRRDRALEELGYCIVMADRSGMVIHPAAARWKDAPEVEEGATVHKDQILLLMPDLSKMQVKVGIHESIVDRIKPGLAARVTLPDKTLDGKVTSVASVTSPAGWWTGNVVKYDTIIELPSEKGLKPGMSAEVEVIMARHENVLTIPVAAVVETEQGYFCWVQSSDGTEKRRLQLGDSNDVFIVIEKGLREGEEVVLNPLAFIEEAQAEVMKPQEEGRKEDKETTGDAAKSNETNQKRNHSGKVSEQDEAAM